MSITINNYMFGGFFDSFNETFVNSLLTKLVGKYGAPIGAGRNRVVFSTGKGYVIKVPINDNGIADNDWESSVSNSYYAKTKGLWLHKPNVSLVIAVQEYVCAKAAFIKGDSLYIKGVPSEIPSWVDSIDSFQIGMTVKGNVVAYDYGIR